MHNVKNNASSFLIGTLAIDAMSLQVHADNFPAAPFWVTIGDEIIEIVSKDATIFTISQRGCDNTSPAIHESGSNVYLNLVADTIRQLQDAEYSPTNHHHDDVYAGETHDHLYAELGHGHDATDIQTNVDNQFVTDTEKSTWNSKEDELTFTPEDITNKGQADGYAPLDLNGELPEIHIPNEAKEQAYIVENEMERLALTGVLDGESAFQRDNSNTYIWTGTEWELAISSEGAAVVVSWNDVNETPSSSPAQIDSMVTDSHVHSNKATLDTITVIKIGHWDAAYAHITDVNNPHALTKLQVGLANMENYEIATQADAQLGTAMNKYMTPLRTKEAIGALESVTSVQSETGHITLTAGMIGAELAFAEKTAFNKPFGTIAGTVAEGNHLHTGQYLTDVNGQQGDVTLTATDLGLEPSFVENSAFNRPFGTGNTDVARGDHEHDEYVVPIGTLLELESEFSGDDVTIRWKDPLDAVGDGVTYATWTGTLLLRKSGGYPEGPTDSEATVVVDSTVRDEHWTNGITIIGGKDDFYALYPYNDKGLYTEDGKNKVKYVAPPPAPNPGPGGSEPTYVYDYGDYIETVEFGTLAVDTNNDGTFDNELDFPTKPWRTGDTGPTGAGNIYSLTGSDGIDLGIGIDAGATNRITIKDTLAEGDPNKAAKTMKWLKFYKKHDLMGGIGIDHDTGRDLTGKANSFIYICDRTLVNRISWEDLDQGDWIYGKEITIDGINYICRAVTGGNLNANGVFDQGALPETNEWDALMVKAHESGVPIWTRGTTEVGDAYGGGVWGQEIWSTQVSSRVRRGNHSPAYANNTTATTRFFSYGWRPALVPVP